VQKSFVQWLLQAPSSQQALQACSGKEIPRRFFHAGRTAKAKPLRQLPFPKARQKVAALALPKIPPIQLQLATKGKTRRNRDAFATRANFRPSQKPEHHMQNAFWKNESSFP